MVLMVDMNSSNLPVTEVTYSVNPDRKIRLTPWRQDQDACQQENGCGCSILLEGNRIFAP